MKTLWLISRHANGRKLRFRIVELIGSIFVLFALTSLTPSIVTEAAESTTADMTRDSSAGASWTVCTPPGSCDGSAAPESVENQPPWEEVPPTAKDTPESLPKPIGEDAALEPPVDIIPMPAPVIDAIQTGDLATLEDIRDHAIREAGNAHTAATRDLYHRAGQQALEEIKRRDVAKESSPGNLATAGAQQVQNKVNVTCPGISACAQLMAVYANSPDSSTPADRAIEKGRTSFGGGQIHEAIVYGEKSFIGNLFFEKEDGKEKITRAADPSAFVGADGGIGSTRIDILPAEIGPAGPVLDDDLIKGVRMRFGKKALRSAIAFGFDTTEVENRLLAAKNAEEYMAAASWANDEAVRRILAARTRRDLDRVTIISLAELTKAAETYRDKWDKLPEHLRFPGSMRRIHGYIIDRKAGDIRIIGDSAGDGAAVAIDELIIGIAAIWKRGAEPLVSLDPELENLGGPQFVRVQGVPKNSRFAKIMLDADYKMKRIALGEEAVSIVGFESKKNLFSAEDIGGTSRFWLTPARLQSASILTSPDGRVYVFDGAMRLLTEELATSTGVIRGTGRRIVNDERVANGFTIHMTEFENKFPIFRRLHALMDISLMASLWRTTNLKLPVIETFITLPVSDVQVPESYPGLSVSMGQPNGERAVVLQGGATMKIALPDDAVLPVDDAALARLVKKSPSAGVSRSLTNSGLFLLTPQNKATDSIEVKIAQAMRVAISGNPEQAFVAINSIVEENPGSELAVAVRAEIEIRLGLFRLAERDLIRFTVFSADGDATRIALARLAIKEGKFLVVDTLSEDDRRVLSQVFFLEALALRRTNAKFSEILTAINLTIRLEPEAARGYALRSLVRSDVSQYDEAIADIEHAITYDAADLKLKFLKMKYLIETEKWQHLLDFVDPLVAANPENAKLLAWRAMARFGLTPWDSDEAYRDINKAVRGDKQDPVIYVLRARIRLGEGDRIGAANDMERAIALAPNRVEMHMDKVKITKDIRDAERLLKLAPGNPKATLLYAVSLIEKGLPSVALPLVYKILEDLAEIGYNKKAIVEVRNLAQLRQICARPYERFRNRPRAAGGCAD